MLKIYVLVFGLVTVVPDTDGKGATVLILDTNQATTLSGTHLPAHQPKLVFGDPTPAAAEDCDCQCECESRGKSFQDVRISLEGDLASQPVTYLEEDRILRLHELYRQGAPWSPASFAVRQACLGPFPGQQCKDHEDQPLLAGRIRLTGGWTIRPVEIDELRQPVLMTDRSTFGFISLNESQPQFSPHVGSVAAGLLFEAEVKPESFTVERGPGDGSWETVSVTPSTSCSQFGQPSSECIRIEAHNIPPAHARRRLNCNAVGTRRIDTHFDRVYDVLQDPPAWRFLPFLFELNEDDCNDLYPGETGGDPPDIKCPVSVIEGAP